MDEAMGVNVLYRTTAKAQGGRDGASELLDGSFSTKLTTPEELGGQGGEGLNPEQLFATGYSACFLGAMKFVASQDDAIKLPEAAMVSATVGIGPRDEGGFGIEVDLAVNLPGLGSEQAQNLVDQTHKVCPYSNATHGNIRVDFDITT